MNNFYSLPLCSTVHPAQVGLLTFDTNVHLQFWLNQFGDKTSLLNALHTIPYTSGATYTQRALQFMRTDFFTSAHGARDGVPKASRFLYSDWLIVLFD
jgi:hypothetical protein